MARLYSSAFYALRDTRTPMVYGILRVILTAALGVFCGLALPRILGVDPKFGAAGLTASAGVAGWIEFALLRRGIARRIGECHLPKGLLPRLWTSAAIATGLALLVKFVLPHMHPVLRAVLVLGVFGLAVPMSCPEVPSEILIPRNTWADKAAYDEKAKKVASLFRENFKKYEAQASAEVRAGGPKL